jgi:Asp-tRNA(Asn)/Glu-tRNA(Gln) amidotransferase A subunit family amidase
MSTRLARASRERQRRLDGYLAICLPCGFSSDGLPYSIQFTGRRLSEATLCRVAHAYERATPWHTRHPEV